MSDFAYYFDTVLVAWAFIAWVVAVAMAARWAWRKLRRPRTYRVEVTRADDR